MNFDRRSLVKAAGSLALFAGIAPHAVLAGSLGANPFTLGVASGDPCPDGFVLWTRLAPKPLEEHGGMPMRVVPVGYEIAEDEGFRKIVASGVAAARPELGHSVHVEAVGLRPGRRYWYRFAAGGEMSPAGTVRTAPTAGARTNRVRMGVAGCQHYETGFYTAYRHLAQEPDLDAIFHYGDYIYEGSGLPGKKNRVRAHVGDEIYTLDDYRRRYALYKSDPDLMAAHAAAAFLVSWDDHEVDNNWAAERDQDGTPPEFFLLRRAAAMQAWYENMPVRRAQFPQVNALPMFRRIDYGDLLRVHVLDTRQYRSDQLCGEGETMHCRSASDPAAVTMLGAAQERWLGEGLSNAVRWNLLAQQVMVMPMRYPETRKAGPVNTDSWSGYPEARQRLVSQIEERGLTNVIVATGDVHKHHAGVVPFDEDDPTGPAAATEFVTTSISSDGDGTAVPEDWKNMPVENPHCKLFNSQRGYQVFDITSREWQTEVKVVDQVSAPGGVVSTLATFSVDPERPGLG